jgi:hypothetical protein
VALLFGGYAGVIHGDTWTWDGLDWTELSPPAPPGPRYGHAMAHDPARGVTVLFAGADAETWEWDGMLWQQRFPPSSPAFRFNHGLAHDPVRQVTVLFGGDLGLGNKTDETWEWNGSTWTEVLPAVRPAARSLHAMVHHPGRGTVLLFGGQTSSPLLETLGDTWEWDGAAWRPITPLVSPPPRSKHAMTYDPVRQVVVLFGGEVGGIRVADTWEAP